jgi:hypothetical protein
MKNDLSDMESVCHYLLRIFVSMFIKDIDLYFSFLDMSLSSFEMSAILDTQNELESVSSLSV